MEIFLIETWAQLSDLNEQIFIRKNDSVIQTLIYRRVLLSLQIFQIQC